MTRHLLVASVTMLMLAPTICGEPVYYAISNGESDGRRVWQIGDLKQFKAKRPANVFDLYTFHRLSDGAARVQREISTRSGEWFLLLIYYYSKDGRLTKIDYDFETVGGLCSCGESGPIRCARSYVVDDTGNLRKTAERVTEVKTGRIVDWTFYEPQVRHWATLRELPILPH